MARIPRRRRSMAKYRRSREERRRLSDGGGSTRHPPSTAEGPKPGFVPQVDIGELTEEEIDSACLFVFNFDEVQEEMTIRDASLHIELDGLCESKALYDAKITTLKKTTTSPDSQKLKQMKSAARESLELGELIDDCKMALQEVNLLKTKAEAIFRSNVSVLKQYADQEEEGCMIGYIARIMKMK